MEQVKDALSESEKLFWYVLDATDDAVLLTDDDGFLAYVSPNTAGLFGLSAEELFEMEHISALLGEGLYDPAKLKYAGAIRHIEFSLQTPRGESRTLRINVRSVELRQGTILYSCRDITEVKHGERVLRDEVQMKDRFIAMACHELCTALTVVQGYSDLLLRQPDAAVECRHRFLSIIFEQAQELVKISTDLLDLGKQCLHLRPSAVCANDLVERVISRTGPKIPAQRLEKRLPEDPVVLWGDQERLERVLEILLHQAVNYSVPQDKIVLYGRLREDQFALAIAGESAELSAEEWDEVFDYLSQGGGLNTVPPEWGLGMNLAKKFVDAHGGRLWCADTTGNSVVSCFSVPVFGGEMSHA